MTRIIDFIKDFELSTYGLSVGHMWIIFGCIIIGFIVANWLASFLQSSTTIRVRRILTILLNSIFYGVVVFMILNAFLLNDYGRLTILIFTSSLPYLRQWMDKFYKAYDNAVDKIAGRR